MSKLFSSKKFFLKPIKQKSSVDYINQSMQNINEPYSKQSQGINSNFSSFNKNNMTVDYPRHLSPPGRSMQSLPPISNKFRKSNNSQKKSIKSLGNSNSTRNLFSQSLFGPTGKKQFEREKTQVNILENNLNENKNNNLDSIDELDDISTRHNLNKLNNNNKITQINNITNINIHIYQSNINSNLEQNSNKQKDNIENIDNNEMPLVNKNDQIINEIKNYQNENPNLFINNNNNIIKNNQQRQNPSSLMGNTGMSIINSTSNNLNPVISKKNNNLSLFSNKNEKNKRSIKGNIKIIPSSNKGINTNKSTNNNMSAIGSMIINSNNNNINNKSQFRGVSQNKYGNNRYIANNSLPEINRGGRSISMTKKLPGLENNLNNIIKEENNENDNHIENIDISMNFLKDLSNNTSKFVSFLKLIQSHMDIELLFDNLENNGNNHFKRKLNFNISNDKIIKLHNLLNNYFNILTSIYGKNENEPFPSPNPISKIFLDNFFLYQSLNVIFHKCIKIQICLFCSIFITLSQLGTYEISTMIKNHFHQITKEILNTLLNIFDTFIKEEINLNYPELITINLRPDFNEHYNKLYKVQKYTQNLKNSELITLISNNLNKCVNSMKYYSTLNLKYSTIKPFGDALNQLLFSIDRKTLNQFSTIALSTLLFGELESNKNRSAQNCLSSNIQLIKNANNGLIGSSISNNVTDFPPFLPQINKKYKYTLVLDMDETLIHYFFTHINGMFFVRPYCLEFLKELNDIYEIVTFTAGTKEYADNILNILDIDNNIIKYRLYRQHTTVLGCSIYKDLSKLGRDLSRVIIIDNLKENFKMQPNNGIFIKTWTNDINDVQLKDILKILKDIDSYNVTDVRPIIQKMNDDIKISRNIIRPYLNINISKYLG